MKPCKRLEIVIEKPLAKRLGDLLIELGAPGYTFLDHAGGRGDRGVRRGDEPTGTSTNCLFIVACETLEEAEIIVEGVRPMLSRSGGICLVSDALWVSH
ncbi:MAG: hypothetical protein ACI9B8_000499 [Sulfitobacter sp.]|jgi:hypothetical protein